MSSVGTSKGLLEVAKFAVYVTVPIGLMYFFANNTKNLQKFMGTVKLSFYLYMCMCVYSGLQFKFTIPDTKMLRSILDPILFRVRPITYIYQANT